jgi:large repetitive protein
MPRILTTTVIFLLFFVSNSFSQDFESELDNLLFAHQNVLNNLSTLDDQHREVTLVYLEEQRNVIAFNFPERIDVVGKPDNAFANWISKYPNEYKDYIELLLNLNDEIRGYSSGNTQFFSNLSSTTGNNVNQEYLCFKTDDVLYFGDFCSDHNYKLTCQSQGNAEFRSCNIQASICEPGIAGPFNFAGATPHVDFFQGCLNNQQGSNRYGFIVLNITESGPLNLLINGSNTVGYIDVSVFKIPPGEDPCQAVKNGDNILSCNYASNNGGCAQFGTHFGCNSSVNPPNVNVGDQIIIIAQDWSNRSSSFTLQLGPPPGAQTGPFDGTINPAGPFCVTDAATQLTTVHGGGTFSGTGVTADGVFNPATAGVGTHTITYDIGFSPCEGQGTIDIEVQPVTTPTITAAGPFCDNSGVVTLTSSPAGGVWSGSGIVDANNGTFNPVTAGVGTHTITYNIGACSPNATTSITVSPYLDATITTPSQSVCLGVAGNINLDAVNNGTWSGTGVTDVNNGVFNPSVAGAGNHVITNTTSGVCGDTDQITISVVDITANIAGVANQCVGTNNFTFNGSGSAISTGTITSYEWTFGDGNTGSGASVTHSYSDPGTYTVTLTVSNGTCSDQTTISVTVLPGPTVTASGVNNACAGAPCTGSVSASHAGGSGGGSYFWDNGLGIGANKTGLCAGTYNVTYTDVSGCSGTAQVVLTDPAPLVPNLDNVVHLACNGSAGGGSVTVSASGGVSPYTFSKDGTTFQASGTFTGLAPGSHTITVKDDNDCEETIDVTINEPAVLALNATTVNHVSCNGADDGSVTVTATGGTPAYEYSLNGGAYQLGATFADLAPGSYTVTVRDANNCTEDVSFNITQPPVLAVTASASDNVCNGAPCNGTVAANNATGGTGAGTYTYTWDGGLGGGQSHTAVCAGTHEVTVEDGNNCTATASVTVNEPDPIIITSSFTDASCNGTCDGEVGVTAVTGGDGNYSYSWSGGLGAGQNHTDVCAGTFIVTVTDGNFCSETASVTVDEPADIVTAIEVGVVDATCGDANGEITAGASGGTPPYEYSLDGVNFQVGVGFTGLGAGTYTLTAKDDNGCTGTVAILVDDLSGITGVVDSQTPVSCNGGSDGTVTVLGGGSVAPYEYSLDGGGYQLSGTFSGLAAGTYTVTVKDDNDCTINVPVTITQPNPVGGNVVTVTNALCHGDCNGEAEVVGTGGDGVYTYSWASGDTPNQAGNTGLCEGTHTVTILDGNLCPGSVDVTIGQPTVLSATFTTQDVLCHGGSSGWIDLTVSGGTSGYTYSWSNSETTQDIFNLEADSYTVTITDANNCELEETVVINEPDPIALGENVAEESCGQVNGEACVTVAGGTGVYTYLWNNGSTNPCRTNVAAGNYTVTVTDENNCSEQVTINVPHVDGPSISASVVAEETGYNLCNAEATVTVTDGTPGFTYEWTDASSNVVSTGVDAEDLCSGVYCVTVTDANNCTDTDCITINPQEELVATLTGTDLTCAGNNSGAITVSVTGGTPGYTYLWNHGPTSPNLTGLAAGTYCVTVTDANNNQVSECVTLTEPSGLNVDASSVSAVLCSGDCNGEVSMTASGGTGNISYLWTDATSNAVGSSATVNNLCPGTYTGLASDDNGCEAQVVLEITEPDAIVLTPSVTNTNCNQADGSASVSAVGGTVAADYVYSWDTGATTSSISDVSAGTYVVTVTDDNQCEAQATIEIADEDGGEISSSNVQEVTCFGGSDGSIEISLSGGTPPFTFLWSNGETTQNISDLSEGNYSVTITDDVGCVITADFDVYEPDEIRLSLFPVNITCFGGNDGAIGSTVIGGIPPYSYNWSPTGQTTSQIDDLTAGTYTLTVTDMNGCSVSDSVELTQPDIVAIAVSINDASCGQSDGGATITVTGGSGVYNSYEWTQSGNSVASTADLEDVPAGNYTITVIDSEGCEGIANANIGDLDGPSIDNISGINALCYEDCNGEASVVVTGGQGVYTYLWSPEPGSGQGDASVEGLCSGTYMVTVTDENGCSDNESIVITQPNILQANINNSVSTTGFGVCDGEATVSVAGGTTGYSYLWDDALGQTTANATGLCAGQYCVTVTDANGCEDTDCVTITEPNEITSVVTTLSTLCVGECNGTASIVVDGGVAPYSISWFDSNNTKSRLGNFNLYLVCRNRLLCSCN